GAEHAHEVDAAMLVEALVLGDDERVLHGARDLLERHERAALEPDLGDEAAVGGVELARLRGRELIELARIGARAAAAHEHPRGDGEPRAEAHAERDREEDWTALQEGESRHSALSARRERNAR